MALALKAPTIQDPKSQTLVIFIWASGILFIYSFLIYIFRMKNGGYPFRLFLWAGVDISIKAWESMKPGYNHDNIWIIMKTVPLKRLQKRHAPWKQMYLHQNFIQNAGQSPSFVIYLIPLPSQRVRYWSTLLQRFWRRWNLHWHWFLFHPFVSCETIP